jgi:hypothetical protein
MGLPQPPPLVTPLVAMLAGDPAAFDAARAPLEQLLGAIEFESPLWPFDKTAYYTATMGAGLQRRFYSFERLADAAALVAWKLATNALEPELAVKLARPSSLPLDKGEIQRGSPARPINLDPGYITGSKLVLASTKNFAHRIYLRDGIYAEITLQYRADGWVGHQFTFPDFKSGRYDEFLSKVRAKHLQKGKRKKEEGKSEQHAVE